jgi:D-alanyl-D-alanine carboxypeptidase
MFRRKLIGPLVLTGAVAVGLFVVTVGPRPGTPTPSTGSGAGASSALAGASLTPGTTVSRSPDGAAPTSTDTATPSATSPGSAEPSPSPSTSPGTSSSPSVVTGSLAARLQKALDKFALAHRLPGASATMTWPDGRSWTGTTGLADFKTGRKVTPDTAFAIASMSKTFTSALILSLVDDGKLSLDTRVATLLPSVRLGTPGVPIPAGVTVRMLLDHTSGLADYFFAKGIDKALLARRGATWTAAQALAYVGKPLGKPGRSWHYSNTNYLLLGLLAEKIAGKPFATQIRDSFLHPLKLDGAYVQVAESPPGPIAQGYYFTGFSLSEPPKGLADARRTVVPFTSVITAAGSAGDVAATSADLAAWARALYGGAVLRPETLAAAVTDAKRTARFHPYVPYGLGVQVTKVGQRRALGHSGRFIGVRGELRYLPDDGLAIAIVANQNGVDLRPLVAKLVALALPKPSPTSTPSPSPAP